MNTLKAESPSLLRRQSAFGENSFTNILSFNGNLAI